jgi:hypothetical protein
MKDLDEVECCGLAGRTVDHADQSTVRKAVPPPMETRLSSTFRRCGERNTTSFLHSLFAPRLTTKESQRTGQKPVGVGEQGWSDCRPSSAGKTVKRHLMGARYDMVRVKA